MSLRLALLQLDPVGGAVGGERVDLVLALMHLVKGQGQGQRCEATAQSALGWYRPSVGVSETFGGYRSSGVLRLTIFSSVQGQGQGQGQG